MKTKLLITGGEGFVAHEIHSALGGFFSIVPLSRADCDITDEEAVGRAVLRHSPDVVIHSAAMVDKIRCEHFPETARRVNAEGSRYVAEACAKRGAKFVFVSSDFVFDGAKGAPYLEKDPPNPLNMYGKTKALGEQHVMKVCPTALIVRTSRLFGAFGGNFISILPTLLSIERSLNVAADVVSNVTYANDFAVALGRLITNDRIGVFHVVNGGVCSTARFAEYMSGIVQSEAVLNGVSHKSFLPGVNVPIHCELSSERGEEAPEVLLRHWKDALMDFMTKGSYGR